MCRTASQVRGQGSRVSDPSQPRETAHPLVKPTSPQSTALAMVLGPIKVVSSRGCPVEINQVTSCFSIHIHFHFFIHHLPSVSYLAVPSAPAA